MTKKTDEILLNSVMDTPHDQISLQNQLVNPDKAGWGKFVSRNMQNSNIPPKMFPRILFLQRTAIDLYNVPTEFGGSITQRLADEMIEYIESFCVLSCGIEGFARKESNPSRQYSVTKSVEERKKKNKEKLKGRYYDDD